MEIIQLNEEIKVKQDQLEVIVLIDYKHKKLDIFKHYEDKVFTSADVVKYSDLIMQAKQIGDERLHLQVKEVALPGRVKVKPEVIKSLKDKKKKAQRIYIARVCHKCGEEFLPTGPRQLFCKKCK